MVTSISFHCTCIIANFIKHQKPRFRGNAVESSRVSAILRTDSTTGHTRAIFFQGEKKENEAIFFLCRYDTLFKFSKHFSNSGQVLLLTWKTKKDSRFFFEIETIFVTLHVTFFSFSLVDIVCFKDDCLLNSNDATLYR